MTMNDMFSDQIGDDANASSGPVTCLGRTFENDEARRAHFIAELRKKLLDPEFRKIGRCLRHPHPMPRIELLRILPGFE